MKTEDQALMTRSSESVGNNIFVFYVHKQIDYLRVSVLKGSRSVVNGRKVSQLLSITQIGNDFLKISL